MLQRRVLVALLACLFIAPLVPTHALAQGEVVMPAGTTLIILRHADRDGEDLNKRGIARSQALVGALAKIKIDEIYSPGIPRNLDTAAPLATARNLKVKKIPMQKAAKRLMASGGGKTIVWIGNKGNLRSIWKDLGAPGRAPLEYGELFVVQPGNSGLKVTKRHFGP